MNEIEALKNTIELNRQGLLDSILINLDIEEIDEKKFDLLMEILEDFDVKRDRYIKALEGQIVVDAVLKDKLT